MACPPRTGRASLSVIAIGHSSWRIGAPSGQQQPQRPAPFLAERRAPAPELGRGGIEERDPAVASVV